MIADEGEMMAAVTDAVNVLNLRGRAERLELRMNRALDCRSIEDAQFKIKHGGARMLLELQSHIYAMPAGRLVVSASIPEDWWQAVRQRWMPAWWLKRHPITSRLVTAEGQLYSRTCPHLQEDKLECHLMWLDCGYGDGEPPDIRDITEMTPAQEILSRMMRELAWMRDNNAVWGRTNEGNLIQSAIRVLADLRVLNGGGGAHRKAL